jgi:hypothetical protein
LFERDFLEILPSAAIYGAQNARSCCTVGTIYVTLLAVMPLVLVQNPVIVNQEYEWKDIVGEQYHFPNQYKNRCRPGSPFVYYRGTRRANGKRAVPEYFGHALIGTVWRDEAIPESQPKKDWAWYCTINPRVSGALQSGHV